MKVVGVGSYKPVVKRLLKSSCSYVLSCKERLDTVDINLYSFFIRE